MRPEIVVLRGQLLVASRLWAWTAANALADIGLIAQPTAEQVEYVAQGMTDAVFRSSVGRDETDQVDFDPDKWQDLCDAVFHGTPF